MSGWQQVATFILLACSVGPLWYAAFSTLGDAIIDFRHFYTVQAVLNLLLAICLWTLGGLLLLIVVVAA